MPNRCVTGPQDFHDSRVKAAVFPTLIKIGLDVHYLMQSHFVNSIYFEMTLLPTSGLPYANRLSQESSLNFFSSYVYSHIGFLSLSSLPFYHCHAHAISITVAYIYI